MLRKLVAIGSLMALCVNSDGAAAQSVGDVQAVLQVAKAGYEIYKALSDDQLSINQATEQILSQISAARVAILNHVDAIAAIEPKACARSAVLNFEQIDNLEVGTQQAFALDVTNCITLLHASISTLQDQASIDQLGFALHVVGPLALLLYTRVGFDDAPLRAELSDATASLFVAMQPECRQSRFCEGTRNCEFTITCTAYNGDRAADDRLGQPPPQQPIVIEALRNTSAAIQPEL